jgi:chromosome segregation ATPase
MSAITYIQSAATQVANAAKDLDRQIKEIRSEHNRFKYDTERQITHLQTEHAGLQAQESVARDNGERDDIKRQQNDLQKQIDQLKQELHQRQQESDQAISSKQVFMNNLTQMSKNLYDQSADPVAQ